MLIDFSVENFLSIKDRITFTMEPTNDRTHPENIYKKRQGSGIPLLTVGAIYGANASGKSNFLNAFQFLNSLIHISHTFQPETRIPVTPFKLDLALGSEPSSFDITFMHKGVRYRYGIKCRADRIVEEYLHSYRTRKPSIIFERRNAKTYRFTRDQAFQEDISRRTNKNALYLSTSAQWNYQPCQDVFGWFDEHLISGTTGALPLGTNKTCDMILSEDSDKNMILQSLRSADLGIFGIEVLEKEPVSMSKDTPMIFPALYNPNKTYDIKFAHQGMNNGVQTTVHFALEEESGGTRKFFQMIGQVIESINKGDTLIIDEFDTSIHPLLLKKIMEMFLDPNINTKGAQLIFSTHSTSLLDSDSLRRDQVWFAEKRKDGSTDLYSLADFPVRKDADFERGYLLGRYGAIPYLPSENLL